MLTLWFGFRMGRRDLVLDYPVVAWLTALVVLMGLSWAITWSADHPTAAAAAGGGRNQPVAVLGSRPGCGDLDDAVVTGPTVASENPSRECLAGAHHRGEGGNCFGGHPRGGGQYRVDGIAGVELCHRHRSVRVVGAQRNRGHRAVCRPVGLRPNPGGVDDGVVYWPRFSTGPGRPTLATGDGDSGAPGTADLGALPQELEGVGFSVVAIPVLAAVLAAALSERGLGHPVDQKVWLPDVSFIQQPPIRGLLVTVLAAATAVAIAVIPATLVTGSLGPGRFATVGIDVSQLVLWWAAEVAVGVAVGLALGRGLRWIRTQEQRLHPAVPTSSSSVG